MHLEGECMLGGRKPKPLLELLSKGFALIILIKANDPSFAILKSELLFGRLPLYKPSIHILLYISISCTSINLHRILGGKIFTIKKSGRKKHLSKCSLQSLYPKKMHRTKNSPHQKHRENPTLLLFQGHFLWFHFHLHDGHSRKPRKGTILLPHLAGHPGLRRDIGGFNQPIPPKHMRFKMGKISQLRTWLRFFMLK